MIGHTGATRRALRRAWVRGAIGLPAFVMVIAGTSALYWPDGAFVGTFGRMLESLMPQLLGFGLVLALGLWGLGGRLSAALILVVVAFGGVSQGAGHWINSAPLVTVDPDTPRLRLVWFNMLDGNPTDPDQLIAALDQSGADVILLTEATALADHRQQLARHFARVQGCERRLCNLMVLGRDPDMPIQLRQLETRRRDRMAVIEASVGDVPVTLIAVHLVKPWFYGIKEADDWHVFDQMHRTRGPAVVVGDFNAAPWSRRLRALAQRCGLLPPRRPIATWPAAAGSFGVPIDLPLVRGGAALVQLAPWGDHLGSNHRGLRMDIVAQFPNNDPVWSNCTGAALSTRH